MAFERVALFGLIDVDLECTGTGTLKLKTDLPGNALAVRETKAIPATSRRVLRFRLQGATKGHIYTLNITPTSGTMRIYGARIWARLLPGDAWSWYVVPVIPSSDWQAVPLPIPQTGEWQARELPIPATSEWMGRELPIPQTSEWAPRELPIPPTSDWNPQPLPIKPTPPNPEWVEIPIDQ
jgi:hypothetical protein